MLPTRQAMNLSKDLYKKLKKQGRARVRVELEAAPRDFSFHKAPPSCEIIIIAKLEGSEKVFKEVKKVILEKMTSEERTLEIQVESIISSAQKISNFFSSNKIERKSLNLHVRAEPTQKWDKYYNAYESNETMSSGETHTVVISLEPKKQRVKCSI
jgi:hypothetical protein